MPACLHPDRLCVAAGTEDSSNVLILDKMHDCFTMPILRLTFFALDQSLRQLAHAAA